MKVNQIWAVYFSPTGGTKLVVTKLAEMLGKALDLPCKEIDFTLPSDREKEYHFHEEDLVVLGSPVYADRVPNKIVPDFQRSFKAEGAAAVPVAVYGNRSYGDALTELRMILEQSGFLIVGGADVVCRHSIMDAVATGRPDERDLTELSDFADRIAEKLKDENGFDPLRLDPDIKLMPYYTPMKEDGTPANFLKAKPVTDEEKCCHCGLCRRVCTMGSINDQMQVEGLCIKCYACIKNCPNHAKYFTNEEFLSHLSMLENILADKRSENVFLY